MAEGETNEQLTQGLLPSFGPNFLEDHARRLVKDPKIALVELVANCWDAGADRVDITWPLNAVPEKIKIKDNGIGMTHDQFITRWRQLNYNRRKTQGEHVRFPPGNRHSHRAAYGRNGKGRHSMFCFASEYFVETWRNGEANTFKVKRTDTVAQAPYVITNVKRFPKEGHGTIVSAELARSYLPVSNLYDLIGSKFVTDPTFEVYLNGERVELTNLEHLIDVQEIDVPGVGTITVSQVDTQKTSRTSRQHGVAWWVNKRLAGEPSWEGFAEEGFIDRRTIEAKRYTFVVEADVLAADVEEDWSGFRETEDYRAVHSAVDKHIRQRLVALMRDIHKERKKAALEANSEDLRGLPSDSRYYIGQMVDGIQTKMPLVKQDILSTTVNVLSNLEKTRSGYTLLEQLAQLKPHELDQLSDILDNSTLAILG